MAVAPLKMTRAEYDQMLARQGGVCAMCGKAQRRQRLSRDHDHVTGRVRGLLCIRCNRALGAFEWDAAVILRLIDYLHAILRDRGLNITEETHG